MRNSSPACTSLVVTMEHSNSPCPTTSSEFGALSGKGRWGWEEFTKFPIISYTHGPQTLGCLSNQGTYCRLCRLEQHVPQLVWNKFLSHHHPRSKQVFQKKEQPLSLSEYCRLSKTDHTLYILRHIFWLQQFVVAVIYDLITNAVKNIHTNLFNARITLYPFSAFISLSN